MSSEKHFKIDPNETYESALRYPEDPTYKPSEPVNVFKVKIVPTMVVGPCSLLRILESNQEAENDAKKYEAELKEMRKEGIEADKKPSS